MVANDALITRSVWQGLKEVVWQTLELKAIKLKAIKNKRIVQ